MTTLLCCYKRKFRVKLTSHSKKLVTRGIVKLLEEKQKE